mgnify:FL=1
MQTYQEVKETYQQIISKSETELRLVLRTIRYISLLRVILFIGIIAVAVFLWGGNKLLFWTFILVPFACFLGLIKWHNRWFYRRDYLKKKIEINRREIEALQGNISAFDDGKEFVDASHLYTFDLDVFGNHSLFQCINRTSTLIGKQQLASWMNNALKNKQAIEERQRAVRELAPELEFRQNFLLMGLLNRGAGSDKKEIEKWIDSPVRFLKYKAFVMLPYLVLLINMLCISCTFCGVMPSSLAGMVFAFFVFFSFLFSGRITKLQLTYGKKLQILSTYADQIVEVEKLRVDTPELLRIKNKLSDGKEKTASQVLMHLVTLMSSLDRRNNIFMTILLNGSFFWELWQTMRIERWKKQYAHSLLAWLEAVGEMDAYCSLATFAYNHPDYVYPLVSSDSFCLKAKSLGHPLMDREKCVRNDICLPDRSSFIIVTGANMAGKSTYLRTVGVNYLLACIGVPVWAERMMFYPVQLVTSLRTTDSLTDNESYFFAELKRLQLIIKKLEAGEELFIILDEILKGTNSVDKQKGSQALIKQFMSLRTNGIIATHDLMLGELSQCYPNDIRNYCFEADITNNELTFSYRMREGVAQNMNACFLMKKMGIAVIEN